MKPTLDLLRALTDEHVLTGLMRHRRLTRAELAAETGISKPTIGESIRRLTELGLVVDTGERTQGGRGKGRVGSYYALAADAGTALAVSIGPEGVVAESLDAHGDILTGAERPVARPARPAGVAAALDEAASAVTATTGRVGGDASARRMPRLAVVSAADPVDRVSGRLVQLPDAPFLLGALDPVAVLAPHVHGPVTVDNDVNWAARAERDARPEPDERLDHFAYVYLGEGLGCAVVSDGDVRRGSAGLAGEIAHLLTTGPHGAATPFIDVFGELGLRQPHSTAVDVERLLAASSTVHSVLARAVAGVVAAVVALADPAVVVLGGPWGGSPVLLDAIAGEIARLPRPVPVKAAALTGGAALAGARTSAVDRLRSTIVAAAAARDASAYPERGMVTATSW